MNPFLSLGLLLPFSGSLPFPPPGQSELSACKRYKTRPQGWPAEPEPPRTSLQVRLDLGAWTPSSQVGF